MNFYAFSVLGLWNLFSFFSGYSVFISDLLFLQMGFVENGNSRSKFAATLFSL